MKKFLTMFVILDLIFVGVVLKIYSENDRSIASLQNQPELTEGQNQKLELIKSFRLSSSQIEVVLNTEMLQSLCVTYSVIELKFKALNVAYSGQEPLITHAFSCAEIKKNTAQDSLRTSIQDLKSLQKNSLLKKEASQLTAHGIYSDEELPNDWRLFSIAVSGEASFNISEAELNKVLGEEAFKFQLTTF